MSCGSLSYSSPEVVNGRPYIGPEVDMWSLGVVLYTLVTARLPFRISNTIKLEISMAKFPMPPHLSEDLRDLLSRILCSDPTKRATVAEVKQSAWLNPDPLIDETRMRNQILQCKKEQEEKKSLVGTPVCVQPDKKRGSSSWSVSSG
jgi:serine/threonine protein kinase